MTTTTECRDCNGGGWTYVVFVDGSGEFRDCGFCGGKGTIEKEEDE